MDKKKFAKTSLIAVSAVAITGLAFATPSIASPSKQTSISAAAHGKGKGKGHEVSSAAKSGKPAKPAEVAQDVTVTVPDDGGTYKLVVTQTATAATTSSTTTNIQANGIGKNHTTVVAVTGTGSVTVSVPGLHPGTYTVELVKVSSSQDLTVTAPTTTGIAATK